MGSILVFMIAVFLYLNMQERIRIQAHLEKLREDCVKDYLSSNLESIASRQVVSDVLKSFLQTNNKEFLESIADSILQAKQNNKRLRESLEQLQTDYQRLVDERRAFQYIQGQKTQNKQIRFLQEKLRELKEQFKMQCEHYCKQIESLQLRVEAQQKAKEVMKQKHQQDHQSLAQMSQILKETQQKLQKKDNILKHYKETSIKQIQTIELRLKLSFLEKLQQEKQSKQAFFNEKAKIHEEYLRILENEKRLLLSSNQELKNQIIESKNQQQMRQLQHSVLRKFEDTNKQQQKMLVTLQALREQVIKYRLQSAELSSQNKYLRQKHQQLLSQIKQQSQNMKEQRKIFEKRLDEILEQNQRLRIFNQQILLMSKKNDSTLDQQAKEISLLMEQHSQIIRALETQKLSNIEASNCFEEQKSKLISLLRSSQEQTKSLMNYNTLQQRQITRLEQQSSKMKEQSSAQMEAYQTTFKLNIQELQEQLAFEKGKNQKYEKIIANLKQQIEGQMQKEKYYHSYLQQIAVLKHKLERNELTKNKVLYRPDSEGRVEKINKKTRIFSLLVEMSDQYKKLIGEHQQIKKWIGEEFLSYRQYFNQLSRLLVNQIELSSNSVKNLDHSCWKNSLSPPNKQTYMNKTVSRGGSLKQQLRAVQERYQTINIQNRTFASNISTLLSS